MRRDEQLVAKLYGSPEWVQTKKVSRQDHKYKPIFVFNPSTERVIGMTKFQPSLSLDFAYSCLENAELLMSKTKHDPLESPNLPTSGASSPTKNGNLSR